MLTRILLLAAALAWPTIPAGAQTPVSPRNLYERLICVVPMTGSGTYEDPRRPMFAPADSDRLQARGEAQILGYAYEVSDDGQFALVEFVARDRTAFEPIVNSARSDVRAFRKGTARREEVEAEFGRLKRNVDWNQFWTKFGVNAR
ncbi:MAG: hypothetical protein KIT09_22590 [Bryobacteraceae bacterium]|nr:hypothetical protein [Bryobacteraceae bacterium]